MTRFLPTICSFLFAASAQAAEASRGGFIPYFADGAGWDTTFRFFCAVSGLTNCTLELEFVGANGQPLPIAIRGNADGIETTLTNSRITARFQRELIIETLGQSPSVVTGSLDIRSNELISGFSIFRQRVPGRPDFEATVPMENRNFARAFLVPFDNRNGLATGIAITNVSNAAAVITIVGADLQNQNEFLGTIAVPGRGSASFDLAGRFPQAGGRAGSVIFFTDPTATTGPFLTGTGFRFNPTGSFTTLPVLNIR